MGAVFCGVGDVRAEQRPDPKLLTDDDAVVRVLACCVCGSDLWGFRGIDGETGEPVEPDPDKPAKPRPTGHEAFGVVEAVGKNVTAAKPGDVVILPFSLNCGHCQECKLGATASCQNVTFFGGPDKDGLPIDGCQGQFIRFPMAQASMFNTGLTEQQVKDKGLAPHLLTLADVMCTGYHAAQAAQVQPGDVVAVVGDGAVGLCAVIGAKLLGAKRIIAMSRHADRAMLAREFGATDIVKERGEAAPGAIRKLLGGDLADAALECVGTKESMAQAISVVRGGGRVGYVGVPHGVELDINQLFAQNLQLGGGMAHARHWMEELFPKVLSGEIQPGKVFDLTLPLADVEKAYQAMDKREAIKVLLQP